MGRKIKVPQEKSSEIAKTIQVPEEEIPTTNTMENNGVVLEEHEANILTSENTDAQGKPSEDKILKKWKNLDVSSMVQRGWQYRVKTKLNGKQFMTLRKGKSDRGLGGYTPSKEKLLFKYYPELKEDFIRRQVSRDRRTGSRRAKPFLSVPISRLAVVPTNYRPTLKVIRYFNTFKANDFPGDFSDFINGNIEDHFVKCNGIILPVLIEESQEEDRSIKNVQ